MPLFMLFGHDVEDSQALRMQTREAHLARIQTLNAQGKVLLAGPCPIAHDNTETMLGSLMVIDFDSRTDAENWAKEEPYLKAGVYSHIDIKPYLHVLPKNAH